jgi:hypothetical protein
MPVSLAANSPLDACDPGGEQGSNEQGMGGGITAERNPACVTRARRSSGITAERNPTCVTRARRSGGNR